MRSESRKPKIRIPISGNWPGRESSKTHDWDSGSPHWQWKLELS